MARRKQLSFLPFDCSHDALLLRVENQSRSMKFAAEFRFGQAAPMRPNTQLACRPDACD